MYLLFFTAIVSLIHPAALTMLANFVMPHEGIALDPAHFNATNSTALEQAWEIHRACKQVGEEIASLKPDLVLLSTPHGIADLRNFVLYLNPLASGFAETDNCNCPPCCYNASVNVDTGMAQFIVEALGYEKNVSGLSGYGPPGQSSEPFPLRWGEVIPFHFISALNESKVVILSHPSRRYSEDVEMIPELLKLGSTLYSILETSPKRVVIVISADLAHTHSASGPYGYSNASQPFDESDSLLTTAASLVDQALSYGYTGLVTLHGLMEAGDITTWTLRVNHHPNYYGMMVSSFYSFQCQFKLTDVQLHPLQNEYTGAALEFVRQQRNAFPVLLYHLESNGKLLNENWLVKPQTINKCWGWFASSYKG